MQDFALDSKSNVAQIAWLLFHVVLSCTGQLGSSGRMVGARFNQNRAGDGAGSIGQAFLRALPR